MIETAIVIAVITGIVEALKLGFNINSKYAPLISIALGILIFGFSEGWTSVIMFSGIVAGLSASGLYSGGKTLLKK